MSFGPNTVKYIKATYDIDGRDSELALLVELVKVVNTSGGLLGDTLDLIEELGELCSTM